MLLIIAVWSATVGTDRAAADTYEVQPGDTLSAIASCLNVSTSVLQALNSEISSADEIFVGQRIQVPDNAVNLDHGCAEPSITVIRATPSTAGSSNSLANSGGSCTHLVQSGDILGSIALDYGTDTQTMTRLNPNVDPNTLQLDSTLIVPCGPSTESPQSEPEAARALTAGALSSNSSPSLTRVSEYTVKENEWATVIADRFGISLEMLQNYNQGTDLNLIHPGDVLLIPVPDYLAPALEPSEALGVLTTTYTVRPNDIASRIAERYGISLADLRRLNGGDDLNHIFIGQALNVPWAGPSSDAAPGTVPAVEQRRRTYRVQPNDTFQNIALKHDLTMDELRLLNPHRPNDLVAIGQLLYLPARLIRRSCRRKRRYGRRTWFSTRRRFLESRLIRCWPITAGWNRDNG